MGEALGDVLALAAGVALSPFPIIAIILFLTASRGRSHGVLFATGALVGVFALGALTLALTDAARAAARGEPAVWVGWLKLGLALALFLVVIRLWRGRPQAGAPETTPRWMTALDTLAPAKIFGLGAFLLAFTPKNLPLIIACGTTIAVTGVPVAQQVAVLAIFTVIASLGVLAPLGLYLGAGERAEATLERWKNWAVANHTTVTVVIIIVIGLKLLGDAIGILTR
jgi:hypothetical protein